MKHVSAYTIPERTSNQVKLYDRPVGRFTPRRRAEMMALALDNLGASFTLYHVGESVLVSGRKDVKQRVIAFFQGWQLGLAHGDKLGPPEWGRHAPLVDRGNGYINWATDRHVGMLYPELIAVVPRIVADRYPTVEFYRCGDAVFCRGRPHTLISIAALFVNGWCVGLRQSRSFRLSHTNSTRQANRG